MCQKQMSNTFGQQETPFQLGAPPSPEVKRSVRPGGEGLQCGQDLLFSGENLSGLGNGGHRLT